MIMRIAKEAIVEFCRLRKIPQEKFEAAGAYAADGFFEIEREKFRELTRTYRRTGLGDIVARFAEPVAEVIDAVAGTELKSCGGCARRREILNKFQI
jgi:hypothetical protein